MDRDVGQQRTSIAAAWLVRRSTLVLALALAVTALLALATVFLPPTATASFEPPGKVFEARDSLARNLSGGVYRGTFLVEARDGNLLDRDSLLELLARARAVRSDPELRSKLLPSDAAGVPAGIDRLSPLTIADAVQGALRLMGAGDLEAATSQQVSQAVDAVLARAGSPAQLGLSARTARDGATGHWRSPAQLLYVLADEQALGGAAVTRLGADDIDHERFARAVLARLRGDERHNQAWGIGVDPNLTSAEQGRAAGPFIGMTIFAVVLLVGWAFRSYWAVALCGSALAALMVWLQGLSNLLGLKSGQILSVIVPIAMISFGVDFAFHAVGRYREEVARSLPPRRALRVGMTGVLGALVLAAASDGVAFLSNVTTQIESLVQFGIAAAMAQVAAFILLGVVLPLALMRVERSLGPPAVGSRFTQLAAVGGSVIAASTSTATVVLSVFLSQVWGVVALAGQVVLVVAVPWLIAARRTGASRGAAEPAVVRRAGSPQLGRWVARAAQRWRWVLPLAGATTVVCGYLATQVQPQFDVRDFFADDSDFVVGLDRLDRHLGQTGGEAATIYVETDLTNPAAVLELKATTAAWATLSTEVLARDGRGGSLVQVGLLDWLAALLADAEALKVRSGIALADAGSDGVPDEAAQLAALYERALGGGDAAQALGSSPVSLGRILWQAPNRDIQATRIDLRLVGSRRQEQVAQARDLLEPRVAELEQALRAYHPASRAVLTGAPIARQATLDGLLRAFRVTLPVALLLCLALASAFMRSVKRGLICIVPIGIVVTWLYAFMYVFDYNINVVTATIGAISIGVGIDFAVHFAARYREEMGQHCRPLVAVERAGAGTGEALVGSALSSVVGFAILAFSPMPMFAVYGLLTAIMILLALVASLLVLPALLVATDRQCENVAPAGATTTHEG